ncbi:hypothetical protein MASSI9I_70203 [Massilia sp. 9I]|nr:hypothetical protein MASSI9I_70203 [Massilia sp. 9I]
MLACVDGALPPAVMTTRMEHEFSFADPGADRCGRPGRHRRHGRAARLYRRRPGEHGTGGQPGRVA